MRIVLEVTAGPHLGRKAVLRPGQTAKIGRTEWADFAFPEDVHLSRVHFLVEYDSSGCRLRDLGSANGTFVNGRKTAETTLNDGDVVRAGQTSLTVHIETAFQEIEVLPAYLRGIVPPRPLAPTKPESSPLATSPTPADSSTPLLWEPKPEPVPPAPSNDSPLTPPPYLPSDRPAGPNPPSSPDAGLVSSLSGAARLVLEVIDGPHIGKRRSLRAGETLSIGRTDLADLALPNDTGLSGMHFSIRCVPDGGEIRDLGSANGTTLNGNRVTAATLSHGNEICAGQSRFRIRLEGSAAASTAGLSVTSTTPFLQGLNDPDLDVRRQALFAAAWTRQRWLLDYCRKQADQLAAENWDAILLLAILGKPEDLQRIEAVGQAKPLGPRRFQAVGAYGHPKLVPFLLEAMASDNPADAAAAGKAFHKITGADVDSDRRVQLLPLDGSMPDEFEKEFIEEAVLPDVARAQTHWSQAKEKFSSIRACRGFDLSTSVGEDVLSQLDMESRWETCLRGRFSETWAGSLNDLEDFRH